MVSYPSAICGDFIFYVCTMLYYTNYTILYGRERRGVMGWDGMRVFDGVEGEGEGEGEHPCQY